MAVPDYFARNAVAASQVLAGFDEERLAAVLQKHKIGITIGTDARQTREGQAQLDLLTRILARLYPTLVFRTEGDAAARDPFMELARRINPNIEFVEKPTFEIIIGQASPASGTKQAIFSGSDGWTASISTTHARHVEDSNNPFGAGVAACLAAANAFRYVFLERPRLDADVTFSAASRAEGTLLRGSVGEFVLVGAGAIGNAASWALSRLPMNGLVHIVDHESHDIGNLQRYVMAERADEGAIKVERLQRYFANSELRVEPHHQDFAAFVAERGYKWFRMLLALDSARDRRAAQASLPYWIADAWTQPGDLGVATHDFLTGACVACFYLPEKALQNEDAIIASSFGTPEHLMQIRLLLHRGEGVPRDLLEGISSARGISLERLLPFEGRPVRALYVEGFCGGAVLPLEQIGNPRQDVHVPLAHQSSLAGVLLAAAAARHALAEGSTGTEVTRLDLLGPLRAHARQPATKGPRGICIYQDADYQRAYRIKYAAH